MTPTPTAAQTPRPAFVHPLADCQTERLGEGSRVWQFCVILPGATIGADCNINCHCFVENDVIVGTRVTLKSGVYLWDGLRIEDDVFIGPNATFTNDRFPRSRVRPYAFVQTVIRKGASIGAGAVILPGVEVGEYAMVAAGAVVTRNVAAHTLVVGSPARPVRELPLTAGAAQRPSTD